MVDGYISGTSSDADRDIRFIIKLVKQTHMLLTEKVDQTFLLQYVKDYCEAITENYRQYHLDTLNRNLQGNYPEYAQEQLDEIENGTANLMKFEIREGRKYYKVVQVEFETWSGSPFFGKYRDRSVHSFVGKDPSILGNVYKPASWKAPHTKHVRFTFQKPEHIRFLLTPSNVDWAGGYLYLR